ncbi:MAG TPA: polyprenyl synthetase family protein [Myxococcales bacterium]|jgi:octaprenyl-diphosphate synthase|nr:polyprenyl synthetase family protein [Myxococcales bacterium]
MSAVSSAGLRELHEAAASPLARPSAAQLLPGAQAAEGISRLERLLLSAARKAPRELTGAAVDLVKAGGKRVRPLLLLLAARAAAPGKRSRGRVALALVAEMVHSATLLHDDVIDDGLTRRGLPAPRVAYGNGVSVIAGDWLLAASLDLALRAGAPGAMEALVRTLRQLVEGESRQIALRGRTDFTADDALQIAHLKTGSLFAFCGEAGALAAGAAPDVAAALRDFGLRAGSAFQIADDLLDFESDAATLGKAVLADVTEGKPSLPLAIALKRLPPLREEMAALLKLEPEMPEDEVRGRVRAFAGRLARTGALGAARRVAEKERDAALAALERVPESPTRELLAQVARALLSRKN